MILEIAYQAQIEYGSEMLTSISTFLYYIVIPIFIHIITSMFIYMYSKHKTGKSSVLAWIPILKLYLLGKLLFNKYIGILLLCLSIISRSFIIIYFEFKFYFIFIFGSLFLSKEELALYVYRYSGFQMYYSSMSIFLFNLVILILYLYGLKKLMKELKVKNKKLEK